MAEEKLILKKFSKDGKEAGQVEVSPEVFGIEPNLHVLHQAVRRELANGRAGTANTKTRGEVRGGGKKPWKQKGTGRARAGSIPPRYGLVAVSPLVRSRGIIPSSFPGKSVCWPFVHRCPPRKANSG